MEGSPVSASSEERGLSLASFVLAIIVSVILAIIVFVILAIIVSVVVVVVVVVDVAGWREVSSGGTERVRCVPVVSLSSR